MPGIQAAMSLLIDSFSKYAGKEGDQHTLTKAELKELLQSEFGEMLGVSDLWPLSPCTNNRMHTDLLYLQSGVMSDVCWNFSHPQKANDKAAIDHIFESLDQNKDNTVDFKEFTNLVTCLTLMCHEYFIKK